TPAPAVHEEVRAAPRHRPLSRGRRARRRTTPGRPRQDTRQQLPELLEPAIGAWDSHAAKKITSKRACVVGENTSATSNVTLADLTRSCVMSTTSGAASIAVTVS